MRQRLSTGAQVGLLFSVIFGGMMLINALLGGGVVRLRRGHQVPLFPLLPLYLLAGPVTGVLYAAALPLMRKSRLLAYLIGVFASVPAFLAIGYAVDGNLMGTLNLVTVAFCSVTLGGFGGIVVREAAGD